MGTYELNDTHLNKYKKYAEQYVNKFGLYEWERYYLFKDFNGSMAACGADRDGRLAMLTLATEWEEVKPTDKEMKAAARHEVLELLLWDLCAILRIPGVTDEEVNAARHAVIRRLENVIT